jgi:hypothetical protein
MPTHVAQDLQSCATKEVRYEIFLLPKVLLQYSMHTVGTRIESSVARPGRLSRLGTIPVRRMDLSCTLTHLIRYPKKSFCFVRSMMIGISSTSCTVIILVSM